ncbi:MAG TPA: GlpM family protein [Spirochaetia bacterium]|nr:GlpM family protein [Spirochaetia bacterium]
MELSLLIKAGIGALIVVIIHFIAQTKSYYIAALIPLFPSFGLFSYYIVGTERGIRDLKTTVVFGIFSLIPYLAFLLTLYFSMERLRLVPSLVLSSLSWAMVAVILILVWNGIRG